MHENVPGVSVILPTYNRAHTLATAIESVLAQTYENLELIVVDDGSTDGTPDLIGTIDDPRLIYLHYQPNRGAAHARNVGLGAARGEFVAFQDSDDLWHPDKLARQVEALRSSGPDIGVVYTDMLHLGQSGQKVHRPIPEVRKGVLVDPETHDWQVLFLGIQTVMARRSCFEEAGKFDEGLPRFIDLELLLRFSQIYSFIHLREELVEHRFEPGISSNPYTEYLARLQLMEKYARELPDDHAFLAWQYSSMARALIRSGRFRKGRSYLFKAVRNKPVAEYLGPALFSLAGPWFYGWSQSAFRRLSRKEQG